MKAQVWRASSLVTKRHLQYCLRMSSRPHSTVIFNKPLSNLPLTYLDKEEHLKINPNASPKNVKRRAVQRVKEWSAGPPVILAAVVWAWYWTGELSHPHSPHHTHNDAIYNHTLLHKNMYELGLILPNYNNDTSSDTSAWKMIIVVIIMILVTTSHSPKWCFLIMIISIRELSPSTTSRGLHQQMEFAQAS